MVQQKNITHCNNFYCKIYQLEFMLLVLQGSTMEQTLFKWPNFQINAHVAELGQSCEFGIVRHY